MADNLDIEPAVLRQLANQHEQVAADIREWAKPPEAWLKAFPKTYGDIAKPVGKALGGYYDARQIAGNKLADDHMETAAALRRAADNLDLTDDEGASLINRSLDPEGTTGSGAPMGAPGTVPVLAPSTNGVLPGSAPVAMGPDGVGTTTTPASPSTPTESTPGITTPGTPAAASTPNTPSATAPSAPGAPAMPSGSIAPVQDSAPTGTSPVRGAPIGHDPGSPVTTTSGTSTAPPVGALAPAAAAPGDQGANPSATNGTNAPPVPVPTPFGAAVAAAKDKEPLLAHVVNAQDNQDLIMARTLLSAVLAAVDAPAVGLAWSVAVVRGPEGPALFLTSNEGRGWLPAGLHLPREVSTPWVWDELLGDQIAARWEGISDPARILAEFALAWGAKSNAGLTALVSSGPIDASLRMALSEVATEGLVGPAYEVDLRVDTPDTVDRLGLIASAPVLEDVARVPDSYVHSRRVELARQAHTQLSRSIPTPPQAAAARALRDRILTAVEAGHPVPWQLWEDLRDADDLLAATMLSFRVDVGRVELGRLRMDDQSELLRAMVFERRCTELALLLAAEPTRQNMRDVVYALEQITAHPSHAELAAIAAPVGDHTRTATTGVTAPTALIGAGPPSGATVTSVGAPPVLP